MQTNAQAESIVTPKGFTVPAWSVVVTFIVGVSIFHVWLHHAITGVFNVHQIALSSFLVVNLIVNFWEIGLLVCGDQVHDEYQATKESYRGREMQRITEIFQRRIPILKILSFREWTGIWSGYALFDSGYAERGSFGFNIDVGNGFSTPVFATLFTFGITFHEMMSARVLGIIGVVMFWQMFYGTVVYFFQFFYAGRHKGHTKGNLALFIGNSNGLWFVFPIWGMILSVWMILNDSYALFL
jgi:hypothetical protein